MDRYNPVQARYTGIMCAIVWQSQIKCCVCSRQIDELRMFIHGRHKAVHLLFVIREANHTSNNVSIATQSINSFDPQEFPPHPMKECRVPQNQPSTLHKTSSFSIISGGNSPAAAMMQIRFREDGPRQGISSPELHVAFAAGEST